MRVRLRMVGGAAFALFTLAFVTGTGGGSQQTGGETGTRSAPALPQRVLQLPETPYQYANIELPAHFRSREARQFDNMPATNPITDNGAALGRVLFYDTRVSANNTVACGSCHVQKHAFADPLRFSKGFEGKPVDRHAMGIANLRFYSRGRFFWDERAPSLEAQVIMPIQSKVEMGQDLAKLTALLGEDATYPELFEKAFGSKEITDKRVARALAQFVRSMVSYQSKFDEGIAKVVSSNEDFPNFTTQENRGKTIFMRNCANCHLPAGQEAHFFMVQPMNNGLDLSTKLPDGGVGDLTLKGGDIGRFKSPSLRNVEFTAPYMHDGRFATLAAVIEHYSSGVQQHPNRDPRVRRFNFDGTQKSALVAFLKTLSDKKFIDDPKFSDPFK